MADDSKPRCLRMGPECRVITVFLALRASRSQECQVRLKGRREVTAGAPSTASFDGSAGGTSPLY